MYNKDMVTKAYK